MNLYREEEKAIMRHTRRRYTHLVWLCILLALLTACSAGSTRQPASEADVQDTKGVANTPDGRPVQETILVTPPDDFGFTLSFGTCSDETLNTFESTFARQITQDDSLTISLVLTEAQMTAVYRQAVEIDLWGHPDHFAIQSETDSYTIRHPSPKYRITVRAAGETKDVAWHDEIVQPATIEASRLRAFLRHIIDIVHDHPGVRQLPESTILCM
jgi:hypothetical protein